MQDEDLKLIRQIVASDGRKYTTGNVDRSGYDHLVDLGWLTAIKNEQQRRRISRNRQGPSGSRGKTILIWEKEDLRLCQDREKTFEGCSFINVLLRPPKNSSMPILQRAKKLA